MLSKSRKNPAARRPGVMSATIGPSVAVVTSAVIAAATGVATVVVRIAMTSVPNLRVTKPAPNSVMNRVGTSGNAMNHGANTTPSDNANNRNGVVNAMRNVLRAQPYLPWKAPLIPKPLLQSTLRPTPFRRMASQGNNAVAAAIAAVVVAEAEVAKGVRSMLLARVALPLKIQAQQSPVVGFNHLKQVSIHPHPPAAKHHANINRQNLLRTASTGDRVSAR